MDYKYITLNNGVKIPQIGFGTWRVPDGKTVIDSVGIALQSGYRHIDTASHYGNETGVGVAIKESGISRDELFITTKLWTSGRDYDVVLREFDDSIEKLGLEYIDLYLIHWPCIVYEDLKELNFNANIWKAFEKLYNDGKAKSIGISNFLVKHLQPLLDNANIIPSVNQLELHPEHQQREIVEFCKKHNIHCEAWSPLMNGKDLDNTILLQVAKKYNKNVGQILLRWSIQKGFIPLSKSTTPDRIKTNLDIFDFNITDEDMNMIDTLDGTGNGYSRYSPDIIQIK
ncbi:MAG: aldo/keto reductase [Rickettsiales bacterium]|jgi:diketogulonate reductase-like aldo/keto reductase|nr:aldo/keto reductase [Rickettsiales bacterium]